MIKQVLLSVQNGLLLFRHKNKWRTLNKHNSTFANNIFDIASVQVGNLTYGGLTVQNVECGAKLKIGNFCSIANGVVFISHSEHDISTVSTFPYKRRALWLDVIEATTKGDIVVKDDVWIGENAIILSGVTINQGAVIAAGAVVTNDVPAYCVVGGVPAKTIRYRFSAEIIDYLKTLDYSQLNKSLITSHINELYEKIDNDIEIVRKRYEWFPKRKIN